MVPLILFFAVAAVGVLSLGVMLSVAWQRFVVWRCTRAQIAARAARLAESARLKIEHAAVLAQLEPRPTAIVAPVAPVATGRMASVGLTQVISTLEQSAEFALAPAIQNPSPRSRMAKGSVPMPMANPTPVVLGPAVMRPAPLPPPNPANRARAAGGSVPPPIPKRAFASVPPPIPAHAVRRGR